MRFAQWLDRVRFPDKEWLVLGKGPSIDHLREINLNEFNLLALNDTVQLVGKADIASFIDWECYYANCIMGFVTDWLLMPERPHVGCKAGPPIEEQFEKQEGLTLSSDPRLVVYPKIACHPSRKPRGSLAVQYFSIEAALGILGELGVRKISTIGIDGGRKYGKTFSHLKPLENGRESFDIQFDAMRDLEKHYGMEVKPLFRVLA